MRLQGLLFKTCLTLLAAMPALATAQYPNKPISMIVPFPAASTTDTIARLLAQHMTASMGQSVLVENRPGAEGQIGAVEVAKAAPDGYKITLSSSGNLSILPSLRKNPPYDVVTDFTPIADVGRYAFFLYVHPSVPATTFKEFIDYVKANPGKVSYATGNNTGVLTIGQLKSQFGLDMVQVPYKGEPPGMLDLVAGRVQAMVATGIGIPYIKENKLRMLVQLLPARSPLAPDVPVLTEIGLKDLPVAVWAGIAGPAGMPKDVVDRLNKEINAALAKPDVKAKVDQLGFALTPSTPEAFARLMKDQAAAYRDLTRSVGLQPE